MYTMEQAEQLAAGFLRQESAGWECDVALIQEGRAKIPKGGSFYFFYQSVDYITTGDDKYYLYGPNCIAVHSATGACRSVDVHEALAVLPSGSGH
ncbi:hypothetical protein OIB37_04225 [Streptomyces sp. NBC_00820]|uniref:hypothetical protein n=1 Tax=Streptomyces sp. NBC_00820 TaxID=2975842 RepID=UPI002ED354E5|nr:hypothetical protein OIB37_04225 [Streptomyces sp. NBC_00820]